MCNYIARVKAIKTGGQAVARTADCTA